MSTTPAAPPTGLADTAFPIERSQYYQRWLEEKRAIDEHKWYLSERAGRDVGYHYAQWDWIVNHRIKWLKERASGAA